MNKFALKTTLPVLATSILFTSIIASPAFAWPTRSQQVDCAHIHWEMQNDTNKTYEFVGEVSEPVVYESKQNVKPNDWGVLDKSWNLNGKVKVKATISMGGDTRVVEKVLDCPVASPSPSPTPSPSPSPSPSASPSPTPSPTPSPSPSVVPSPTPSPCTNCGQEQHQTQNNNQTVNVTVPAVLPATGPGEFALLSLVPTSALGFALRKFRRGVRENENLSEFASGILRDRTSV